MRSYAVLAPVSLILLTLGCDRTPEAKVDPKPAAVEVTTPPAPTSAPAPAPSPAPLIAAGGAPASGAPASPDGLRLPSRSRVVAIGDIHGDLVALRSALRLAGAIDASDHFVGKDLTVVQTGDQLDRGDQDREVLDLLERLEGEAERLGSALYVLNGNHELMNAAFDFRYVTTQSLRSFAEFSGRAPAYAERLPGAQRGRAAAFAPGAPYALKLARHLTIAVVGDSLFAHGGVLPAHVDYGLSRINIEARSFLAGKRPELPAILASEDSPVWTRVYGEGEPDAPTCQALGRVLEQLGAKRLVVGHTVQKQGISSACQGRVFRIDVGLSKFYGDNPSQVLEITAKGVRVLTAGVATESARQPGQGDRGAARNSALHSAP